MKKIDIKELGLNDQRINELLKETVVSVNEDGKPLFYLVPSNAYDETVSDIQEANMSADVRIIGPNDISMTYDQYVLAREQLISVFDKCFKPDAEKMN